MLWPNRAMRHEGLGRQFGPSVGGELGQAEQLAYRRIGFDFRDRRLLAVSRVVAPIMQNVKRRHELALNRGGGLTRDVRGDASAAAGGFVHLQGFRPVSLLGDGCREQDRLGGGASHRARRQVVGGPVGSDRVDRALSEARAKRRHEAGKNFGHAANVQEGPRRGSGKPLESSPRLDFTRVSRTGELLAMPLTQGAEVSSGVPKQIIGARK
jgi:hypothetical protein